MATVPPFRVPYQSFSISRARDTLEPEEFRQRLRKHLQDHPNLTLQQVATILGLTRQRVSQFVGPLGRLNCAQPNRPAPKRDRAKAKMAELELRVLGGESASAAAATLGVSLNQAAQLGFRSRQIRRSPHGTKARAASCCSCWRCRRASGAILPRGPKIDPTQVLDWCAWVDPDDGRALTQQEVARLCGVVQPVVSRITKGAAQ